MNEKIDVEVFDDEDQEEEVPCNQSDQVNQQSGRRLIGQAQSLLHQNPERSNNQSPQNGNTNQIKNQEKFGQEIANRDDGFRYPNTATHIQAMSRSQNVNQQPASSHTQSSNQTVQRERPERSIQQGSSLIDYDNEDVAESNSIQDGVSQNIQTNVNQDDAHQANQNNPEAIQPRTVQKIMPGEYLQQIRNARRDDRKQVEGNEQQTQGQNVQRNPKMFHVPDVYYFDFDKPGLEKPWNDKDKNDEYFNYGFNEESFKVYQQKIQDNESKNLNKLMQDQEFEQKVMQDQDIKYHQTLNFYLPHEFGGCGNPFYEEEIYGLFNIYKEKDDLAIIKPRHTNKQEFQVELKRNEALDEIQELEIEEPFSARIRESQNPSDVQLSKNQSIISRITAKKPYIYSKEHQIDFARNFFERTIIKQFENIQVPELKSLIDQKQVLLEQERNLFQEVNEKKEKEYQKVYDDYRDEQMKKKEEATKKAMMDRIRKEEENKIKDLLNLKKKGNGRQSNEKYVHNDGQQGRNVNRGYSRDKKRHDKDYDDRIYKRERDFDRGYERDYPRDRDRNHQRYREFSNERDRPREYERDRKHVKEDYPNHHDLEKPKYSDKYDQRQSKYSKYETKSQLSQTKVQDSKLKNSSPKNFKDDKKSQNTQIIDQHSRNAKDQTENKQIDIEMRSESKQIIKEKSQKSNMVNDDQQQNQQMFRKRKKKQTEQDRSMSSESHPKERNPPKNETAQNEDSEAERRKQQQIIEEQKRIQRRLKFGDIQESKEKSKERNDPNKVFNNQLNMINKQLQQSQSTASRDGKKKQVVHRKDEQQSLYMQNHSLKTSPRQFVREETFTKDDQFYRNRYIYEENNKERQNIKSSQVSQNSIGDSNQVQRVNGNPELAVGRPLKDLRKIIQKKETSEQDEHRHNNRSRDVKSNRYYESDRYYKNRKNC